MRRPGRFPRKEPRPLASTHDSISTGNGATSPLPHSDIPSRYRRDARSCRGRIPRLAPHRARRLRRRRCLLHSVRLPHLQHHFQRPGKECIRLQNLLRSKDSQDLPDSYCGVAGLLYFRMVHTSIGTLFGIGPANGGWRWLRVQHCAVPAGRVFRHIFGNKAIAASVVIRD